MQTKFENDELYDLLLEETTPPNPKIEKLLQSKNPWENKMHYIITVHYKEESPIKFPFYDDANRVDDKLIRLMMTLSACDEVDKVVAMNEFGEIKYQMGG